MPITKNIQIIMYSQICRKVRLLLAAGLIIMTAACSLTRNTVCIDTAKGKRVAKVSLNAGAVTGGIVENSKMAEIEPVSGTDAITGATHISVNTGIHISRPVRNHDVETGIDYVSFHQLFTYLLSSDGISGTRDFRFHQLRLPLTVNFHVIKNSIYNPVLVLKVGLSVGYTFKTTVAESGTLPQYTFNEWDYGPTLGITFYPLQLKGKKRIGFYLDLYRGSRIYDDIYHKAEGMGGQSILKAGVSYQF